MFNSKHFFEIDHYTVGDQRLTILSWTFFTTGIHSLWLVTSLSESETNFDEFSLAGKNLITAFDQFLMGMVVFLSPPFSDTLTNG